MIKSLSLFYIYNEYARKLETKYLHQKYIHKTTMFMIQVDK